MNAVFAEMTQKENAAADDSETPDMTGPRRPQRRGPVAGPMLTSDPAGRLTTIAVEAADSSRAPRRRDGLWY